MSILDAVRSITSGIASAAGNDSAVADLTAQRERSRQAKANEMQQTLAPLHQALTSTQQELSQMPRDPKTGEVLPDYKSRHDALVDQASDIIGKYRTVLHPPPTDDPHGLSYLAHAATDKLHITSHARDNWKTEQDKKIAAYNQQTAQQVDMAIKAVPPPPPDKMTQTIESMKVNGATPEQIAEHQRETWTPLQSKAENAPEKPEKTAKPPAEPKPLESGGVLYGVSDPETGKQYLASQMNDPNTPQNIKEIWNTVKTAQTKKQEEADKKERERESRFLESQANIAARLGQSEAFQARMVDYREKSQAYKALDTEANKAETEAATYDAQYKVPGNHSATDTALIAAYTSVLAKGGRKTQAELQMARQIGDFKLNMEQKFKKATTGELPDELRQLYLNFMKSAAKTAREEAEKVKPELPTVTVPQGPKTKALKQKQGGNNDPLGLF